MGRSESTSCGFCRNFVKGPLFDPLAIVTVFAEKVRCVKMATCSEEDPKNKPQPQLMKLDRAFKLAELWVNNMSKSSVDQKSISVDLEGRPSRLGIGATVPKASRTTRSDNPVERKLIATLNAGKKKIFTGDETPSAKGENGGEDSDEDESESKTRSFTKKRPPSFSRSLLHSKKKHK